MLREERRKFAVVFCLFVYFVCLFLKLHNEFSCMLNGHKVQYH